MANNMVKFYKVASLPSTLVPGAIYFVTTTQSIYVATSASAADKFGIGLKDASLVDSKLTITRYDGTTVEVDFSDIASASSVVAALALKADKTQVAADIAAAQAAAIAAAKVKDVDTTATNGINLSVDANGKLDVTVSPGAVANGNAFVVTGDAVYGAIASAKTELSGQISSKNVEAEGDELVSATAVDNKVTVAATETLTSAVALANSALQADDKNELSNAITAEVERATGAESELNARVATIEGLLAEDGNDTIDNLKDVINYFAGVKETETGAALISDVATIKSSYVKSVKTTDGSNGYVTLTPDNATAGEVTIAVDDSAIASKFTELENQINDAVAGSVTSFGGKTGAITVKGGQTGNGSVNLTMSDNELQASIVGLGSAAYTDASAYATSAQGALADTAVQVVEGTGFVSAGAGIADNSVEISVSAFECPDAGRESEFYTESSMTNDTLITAAAAKGYTDYALSWVEFN